MSNYQVKINFNDGTNSYDFPLVQACPDPIEGSKAVVIEGNRADGAIVIPGGKKSQEITIKGIIFDSDGYVDIQTKIAEMKTKVTTNLATLTKKYWNGATWINTWSYAVRRIEAVDFSESFQTNEQQYTVRFLIVSY